MRTHIIVLATLCKATTAHIVSRGRPVSRQGPEIGCPRRWPRKAKDAEAAKSMIPLANPAD
eukprot:12469508-Alexandrium_andersonii.AAC.1